MPHPIHKLFEKAVRLFFDNMAAGQTRFKRGAFGTDLLCKSAFGLTGVFGWEGDCHAPIAFIDGSYLLRDRGNVLIHFGFTKKKITSKVDWYNAEDFLPCLVSHFEAGDLDVTIANFADKLTLDGHDYVAAYSRVTMRNRGDMPAVVPPVSTYLEPLTEEIQILAPGETAQADYVVGADRFGGKYPYPSADKLCAAGGYDAHYAHMRAYWLERLSALCDLELPEPRLVHALKAGYIYTMIVKDGDCLHVGENGYDAVFDHDVIGITASLVTLGDFRDFKAYVTHILDRVQYPDARWKYSWPFALYLMKTGDTAYIADMLPTIRENTRTIEADRTSQGWMRRTTAIDSLGFWTVDDWSALTGLAAYHYICTELGEDDEAAWARAQYDSLLAACETQLSSLREKTGIPYIPISLTESNETGPRSDPRDANALSMFLFGRWAWEGYLFGMPQPADLPQRIDATYDYVTDRRSAISDSPYNFGGYPHGWYCSAYNAGYGSAGLRGERYRAAAIEAYRFMIDRAVSGPYSWWEGVHPPRPDSPWNRPHASGGGGSCPHMWGQATASKALLDALVSEKADGTLVLCRGIPDAWRQPGSRIAVRRFPVRGGRIDTIISFSEKVTVCLSGAIGGRAVEWDARAFRVPENVADWRISL